MNRVRDAGDGSVGAGTANPEAPVRDLGLGAADVQALARLRVFCLEDLAACTEDELVRVACLGSTTVSSLKALLAGVSMSLLNPEPPCPTAPSDSRGNLARRSGGPDDRVATMPLFSPSTMRGLQALGFNCVDDLRALSVRELVIHFRNRQAKEIYRWMIASGRLFRDAPRPMELWRLRGGGTRAAASRRNARGRFATLVGLRRAGTARAQHPHAR